MEIRTTNFGRGRSGYNDNQPPAYTSRIDLSQTEEADAITLSEDVMQGLIHIQQRLQETMERLSLKMEMMITVANN
jgi:hypothetical protein